MGGGSQLHLHEHGYAVEIASMVVPLGLRDYPRYVFRHGQYQLALPVPERPRESHATYMDVALLMPFGSRSIFFFSFFLLPRKR